MKEKVRVSFDVPIEEHTLLKAACVEAHIPVRNLMQVVFHQLVGELRGLTKEQVIALLIERME